MEKLFNWTIGSFFRTIGRLIAYFAIGAFIAYILSNSNIKLPRITNLFLDHVSASEMYNSSHFLTYYTDDTYNTTISGDQSDFQTITQNSSTNAQYSATLSDFYIQRFTFSQNGYITIPFNITYPNVSTMTHSTIYGTDMCTRYQCTQWDSNNECLRYTCDFTSTGQDSDVSDREYITPRIVINASIFTNNQFDNHMCEIENNLIKCSINSNSYPDFYKIRITSYVYYSTTNSYQYYVNLGRVMTFYTDTTTNAIQSQTQQQQQQHNETMTIITDTNTTEQQNETTSFFESFTFSSDNSGLFGVVTAPLRVINSVVSGQFSDLCFTLKSKNVCFPNGNMIWQKQNRDSTWFGSGSIQTGIQAFVTLFNLVAGGFILYKMGLSIKRLTEDLINPTNTRIEVMKL